MSSLEEESMELLRRAVENHNAMQVARAALDAYATASYFLDSEVREVVRLIRTMRGIDPICRTTLDDVFADIAKRLEKAANHFRDAHVAIEAARFGTKEKEKESTDA